MSGPWDRPPSPSPDDRDWPTEDLESSAPADPWSRQEPWSEPSSDASPGWDEWPPPAPPLDDFVVEEPTPPSSDPWAESWTDDAGIPHAPASQDAPGRSPQLDEPRAEPWTPMDDPWGPASVDTWTPAEPWRDEPADEVVEPTPYEPPSTPEPMWEPAQPVDVVDDTPAEAPDERLEPGPTRAPQEAGDEAEPTERDDVIPARRIPTDEAESPATEPEPPAELHVDEHADHADQRSPSRLFGRLFGRTVEPPIEPVEPVEPVESPNEAAAADEPSAPAHEPGVSPGAVDTPPEVTGARVEPSLAPPSIELEPSDPEPSGEVDDRPWDPDPWAVASPAFDQQPREEEPGLAEEAAAESAPEPEPAAEPDAHTAPESGPDVEATAEPEPEPAWQGQTDRWEPDAPASPTAEPEWPSDPWPDRGDSTQVLPTSWAPTPSNPREESGALDPSSAAVRTKLATPDEDDGAAESPTTAEQAVPWLIGVILLLAGMVIVLLALIFAGDASLGGAAAAGSSGESSSAVAVTTTRSPTPSEAPSTTPRPTSTSAEATPEPTPSPIAIPEYGPLEMIYQGRSAALAPIYLLHRDFTVDEEPVVLAQDPAIDVRRFAWAVDGTVGAGLYSDVLVSIEIGEEKRRLGRGISAITFGDDATTLYAAAISQDGGNSVASVQAIDFKSGKSNELASISYPRPAAADRNALAEAQFVDDGGEARLFWMQDDTLRLWVRGGGTWSIDREGKVTEVEEALPTLLAPDGERRITLEASGATTVLSVVDEDGEAIASTEVTGAVSHVRWSPNGDRIVFTAGRSASGGGILQDLFLWDLADGQAPVQLTATGAAFGAEWRGSQPVWRE